MDSSQEASPRSFEEVTSMYMFLHTEIITVHRDRSWSSNSIMFTILFPKLYYGKLVSGGVPPEIASNTLLTTPENALLLDRRDGKSLA